MSRRGLRRVWTSPHNRSRAGLSFAVESETGIKRWFVPFVVRKRGVDGFVWDTIIVRYLIYVAINDIEMPNERPNRHMTVSRQPCI